MRGKDTRTSNAETSPSLPFPTGRGQQLNDLRDIRLGSVHARLLLFVLDNRIGSSDSWRMCRADLQAECELKDTAFKKALRLLKSLGLVSVDPLPGTGLTRYRLVRSNINELAEETRSSRDKGRNAPSSGRNAPSSGRIAPFTSKRPRTYQNATTPNPLRDDEQWGAVVAEMRSLGVAQARPALQSARKRGATPDEITAGIDHFRRNRPAWQAGALQRWVSNWEPGTSADENWPQPKASTAAARVQEDAAGLRPFLEQVDQLTPDDLKANAADAFADKPVLRRQFALSGGRAIGAIRTAIARHLRSQAEVTR